MKAKKVHLSSLPLESNHNRSACRHTSRPGRNLIVLSLKEFIAQPSERKCKECMKEEIKTL